MTVLQWDDMNYDDEEFTEFSEFEIKKNSKKKERRGTNKMRKQQRLKKVRLCLMKRMTYIATSVFVSNIGNLLFESSLFIG